MRRESGAAVIYDTRDASHVAGNSKARACTQIQPEKCENARNTARKVRACTQIQPEKCQHARYYNRKRYDHALIYSGKSAKAKRH